MFFIISQTITYVNIILPAFIVFIFYLFDLERNNNFLWYWLYLFSYLFLITSRPDFFFLALIIEILNAYFKNRNIITLWQNIFFYIFLIPYYFIINHYLLTHISQDEWLLWRTYETDNFWYIIYDKIFWEEMLNKIIQNIQIIWNDYLFILFLFIVIIWNIFLFLIKKQKNIFNILFLFIYSIFFFFIVIFIHKEWFIESFFKYFSMVYLIIFILFWILILKLFSINKDKDFKILWYIILGVFIIFNYNISLWIYKKLNNYLINWDLYLSEKWFYILWNSTRWIYEHIYNKIIVENILYKSVIIKNKCKILVNWKFNNKYNRLYLEYWNIYLNWLSYNISDLKESKCVMIYNINSMWYSNFKINNTFVMSELNNYFIVKKVIDKYINDDFWLNLYILKNKNAK
jgi:hypothetical protein